MVGALTISFDAKQLQVCEKCFMEEKDSIKLASQLKLISPLIVGDINKCELCYKKDENRKDKSSIFRPYHGSCIEEQAALDRFGEVCCIESFSVRIYPDDK